LKVPGHEDVHLTYCLNVHPGETFEQVESAVFDRARAVFAHVAETTGHPGPFGLGMWLSAVAAESLREPLARRRFAERLREAGLYVFTLNGFPYGCFHGERVKENVYRPDWSDPRRRDYTLLLADILADLLPDGVVGTISTLPVTYRPWADEHRVDASVRALAEVALYLAALRAKTGVDLCLALEPEPDCYLDETDTVVEFFRRLMGGGAAHLVEHAGLSPGEAADVLRRHLGVCLDAIHCAVLFEDPRVSIRRLSEAGIGVAKMHLGAALVAEGEDGPPESLRPFQDDVYLHQVRVGGADGPVRFADLPEAFSAGGGVAGPWRVHYHVPLCWEGSGGVGSTREAVSRECLATALAAGVRHFEVETYTLDVFPGAAGPVEQVLADDVVWALARLSAGAGTAEPSSSTGC